MTREEIVNGLEDYTVGRLKKERVHITVEELQKYIDEIKALEPCEDAINCEFLLRDLLLKAQGEKDVSIKWLEEYINSLLSATPIRPKGHWIEEINDYGEITGWHCDKCYEDSGFTTTCKWDFCPNCGTKMVEPQESEVEE